MDLDKVPLQVVWETTQASDGVCEECQACRRPDRHPDELTTEEGFQLVEEVRRFAADSNEAPTLVFTGGDPLKRPDLMKMVQYAVDIGLPVQVNCTSTPLLDVDAMEDFFRAGVKRIVLRLDTPDAPLAALFAARDLGLEVELETAVRRDTISQLERVAQIAGTAGARIWTLLFPVAVPREDPAADLGPDEYEKVFETIWLVSRHASFGVRTSNASHYRRFVARKLQELGHAVPSPLAAAEQREAWELTGFNAGRGLIFVSHLGDVFPSSDLDLLAGNVRTESLIEVYRKSTLFRALRDPDMREGKCGDCEYRCICGGSRARAYAMTGNFLAEDPRCFYHPGPLPVGGRPLEKVEFA